VQGRPSHYRPPAPSGPGTDAGRGGHRRAGRGATLPERRLAQRDPCPASQSGRRPPGSSLCFASLRPSTCVDAAWAFVRPPPRMLRARTA
jgi:hypothetical protein